MLIHRNDALPQVEIKVSERYDEYACRLHSHREYSLGIIHKGITRDNLPGEKFILKKNDTILFPPEIVHLCRPDRSRPFSFTMIYLEQRWFESAFLDKAASPGARRGVINEAQLRTLGKLIEDLPAIEGDIKSWEEDFIQCIGSVLQLQDEESGPSVATPELTSLIEGIRQELDLCPAGRRSLEEIAAGAGISRYSLIRRFRKAFGLPPHAYLQNRRIRFCQQALKRGEEMSLLALDAGFTDQSHMIRTFRLYTGMTPGEYLSKQE